MKDETAAVAIKEFVGLKLKMYSYLVADNREIKKAKGINKNVVVRISHNEIQWIGFKVKIIEQEFMKSTRFLCLPLIIKYTCKTMDMMDELLYIRVVNYHKKTVTLITIQKTFLSRKLF